MPGNSEGMVNFELKPQRVVVMLKIDPSASVARIVFSGGGASGQRDYAVRPNARFDVAPRRDCGRALKPARP
jgi:hypothetical protein